MSISIPLHDRAGEVVAHALVDDVDAAVANARWYKGNDGYARRKFEGRVQLLHRHLLGLTPGDTRIGDHINGDRLDNRRTNIRIADRRTNSQNRRVMSASGFRGVTWHKRAKKWQAAVKLDDRNHYLGLFETAEAAAEAAAEFRRTWMPGSREAVAA